VTLGFLVAAGGFTSGVQSTLAAERKSKHLVVPIDHTGLQRLVQAKDRSEVLKDLHQKAIEVAASVGE
jgi:hypothetical protein